MANTAEHNFFKNSIPERKQLSAALLIKYPNSIPVFLIRGSNDAPNLPRRKILVAKESSMGEFMFNLNALVTHKQSFYLFINGNVLPTSTDKIISVYEKYRHADGFLYITYYSENTFG
jgi:GABA(A) receptor-associated protein